MTILGIDWGERKLGLAISREAGWAFPLGTVAVRGFTHAVEVIQDVVQAEQVAHIVLGLPLGLDGKDTPQTSRVREVAADVGSALGLPVSLVDERLTSQAAQRLQRDAARPVAQDDTAAAVTILQTYLSQQQ